MSSTTVACSRADTATSTSPATPAARRPLPEPPTTIPWPPGRCSWGWTSSCDQPLRGSRGPLRDRGGLPDRPGERLVLAHGPRQRRPVHPRVLAGAALRGHGAAGLVRASVPLWLVRVVARWAGPGRARGHAHAPAGAPGARGPRPGGGGAPGPRPRPPHRRLTPLLGLFDHCVQPGGAIHADPQVAGELDRLDRGRPRLPRHLHLQGALPDD